MLGLILAVFSLTVEIPDVFDELNCLVSISREAPLNLKVIHLLFPAFCKCVLDRFSILLKLTYQ